MSTARHPRPPELAGLSLEQIAEKFVARSAASSRSLDHSPSE